MPALPILPVARAWRFFSLATRWDGTPGPRQHFTSHHGGYGVSRGMRETGNKGALIMADLPFMSYASESQTLENAASLMRAGAQIVKLEGGAWIANTTRLLAERGIPVCAHMGLTPQSVNQIGGFHVQADTEQAQVILDEALLLQESGANLLLLECVPKHWPRPSLTLWRFR